MPSHSEMASLYQNAMNQLLAVKTNLRSTPEQRAQATSAIDELNRSWIGDVRARYQERTASLNALVERLNAVSASLESGQLDALKAKLNKAAARARNVLHATASEALEDRLTEPVPEDPDAVDELPAPPAGEPASPPAADADTSAAGDVPPPPRPSLPPVSPTAQQRKAVSTVPGALFDDYSRLFASCLIRPDRIGQINRHLERLDEQRVEYERVGDPLGIPWWFVGVIHGLESGYRLACHLHNGDPLSAPTLHVPKDRPPGWADVADKTWSSSARDALTLKGLDAWDDWSVQGVLFQWERYNGFGYRKFHAEVLSPYLWSFTNHYVKGKYVADGRFDGEAVSAQAGAAAILRHLVNKGVVSM